MITLEEAKALTKGTVLHRVSVKNADGTPQRWRVNGKPKVWKTRPYEVQVPLKFGLKAHDYMDEEILCDFCLDPEVIERAETSIANEDDTVRAFMDERYPGQQLANIKHTMVFKKAFIAWLEGKTVL